MSQILLVKLHETSWSYAKALTPSRHCRLDPASGQHGATVDEQGILHYFHVHVASRSTKELLSFQLQFRASSDAPLEPISKPWMFEFVPGLPGELMIVQEGSVRILYASLPRQDSDVSDVCLFGSHTAPINCIINNGNIALSGCNAGILKLWRLADGQLADSVPLYDSTPAAVTAVECIGPLLVAAGNSAGAVTLYDMASGRLLAVQRLEAGRGPVSCLTSWLDTQLLSSAVLAPPGPRVPDGGGVLPGPNIGSPWGHQQQQQQLDYGDRVCPPAALLAVSSPSGWLRVYQASQPGPDSWQLLNSSHGALASPITALAFTPGGDTLAVASPAAQITGTDAVAVAAAGGQPGAVSLYRVGAGSRVQQEMQLWQQWCLNSMPVGLVVLPSSHVELITGKRLEPTQVLHLLVAPELGPTLVLTATRPLVDSSSSSRPQHLQLPGPSSPQQQQQEGTSPTKQQQQQQQEEKEASYATEVDAVGGRMSPDIAVRDWAAVVDAIQKARPLQGSESEQLAMLEQLIAETDELLNRPEADFNAQDTQQQQQQQQQATDTAAASQRRQDAQMDHQSKQHQQQQQQQTDASKAAGARKQLFAGGTSPQDPPHRASLQASSVFDQGLTVVDQGLGTLEQGPVPSDSQETTSARFGDISEQQQDPAAAAGGGGVVATEAHDEIALAEETFSVSAGLGNILAEAAAADEAFAEYDSGMGAAVRAQGPAAAASSSGAAAAAAAAAGSNEAAGGAVGGDVLFMKPSTLPTLRSWMDRSTALAAGTAADGPIAAVSLEAIADEMRQHQEAVLRQQQQQEQQQEQDQGDAAASSATGNLPEQQQQQQHSEAEDELPCESTFQHLVLDEEQQQQQQEPQMGMPPPAAAEATAAAGAGKSASPELQPLRHEQGIGASSYSLNIALDIDESSSAAAAAAAAAAAGDQGLEEPEPQPRALPAVLQMQRPRSSGPRTPGAHQQRQGTPPAEGVAAVVPKQQLPQFLPRPTAASIPAAVQVTSVEAQPMAHPVPAGAADSGSSQQQQTWPQQARQQQQQRENESESEQAKAPRNVRERLRLRQRQQDRQQQEPTLSSRPAAAAAAADVVLPVNDHPLAAAVLNSSKLLARKIQEAEEAPQVTIDPSDVVKLAVQLTDLDVDFDQQQYQNLADLKDIATPIKAQRLVSKQLDARWLASRNLKPQMETLFKPSDWQPSNVQPQVLILPQWPTPQQVVQRLLWPQAGQAV